MPANNDFTTPMMKQFQEIKDKYKDCLLFYRMGDFYELFLEDAHIGSKVLGITLTGKSNGKNERIPMAGVPYHAVDNYLNKLVKAGYKVAICEQLSPPNKKGLVERDVVRIVTPGTILNEHSLEQKRNNYITCLAIEKNVVGIAIADISTGYFAIEELTFQNLTQTLKEELAKIAASECIVNEKLYNNPQFLKTVSSQRNMNVYCYPAWQTHAGKAKQLLQNQFGVSTLAGLSVDNKPIAQQAAAVLLGYLQETQKSQITHIKNIVHGETEDHVAMDRATIINLELFSTIREHDTKNSLLAVLDHTHTAMGGRKLKQWISKPLVNKTAIEQRHEVVTYFLEKQQVINALYEQLKRVVDIERILSRLSVGLGNARDVINLKETLKNILEIKQTIKNAEPKLLQANYKNISSEIETLIAHIEKTIVQEPPLGLKDGGIITQGIDAKLDELRSRVGNSKEWMEDFEKKEKERSGIASLKVRFNKVFGFYIEISKANLHLVPSDYQRKQTLVNGERFVTKELKEHEEIILRSEEVINYKEYEIFQEFLSTLLSKVALLQAAAEQIATIDCLANFAFISQKYSYVRPKIIYSGEIRITNGRHPVVENVLEDKQFVPNNVTLDNIKQQLLLITGPNMAGKSVLIRQVALIVLMNQIGCFVPAEKAHVSIVDKIFVRSGASDVITSGLSTFMVEMVETAAILHSATKNSLIVMDEIGRGTSTYDGISIAWAVAQYLVEHYEFAPKTLFATHYHELQELEELYPGKIKNYHMAVASSSETASVTTDDPIFLHTLVPGPTSHSFGVAVAKLAGVPKEVIENANAKLKELEKNHFSSRVSKVPILTKDSVALVQNDDQRIIDHLIHKELGAIDIAHITPLEAINTLAKLIEKTKLTSISLTGANQLEN